MEDSRFRDKSLRIIGVDPSGAVRQLMKQLMTDAGFKNFEAMASTKDVVGLMEQETIDWIILPMSADEDIHGLQVARLVSLSPEIRKTRISLLVSDDETQHLGLGFELGVLSWFSKPFNKDSLAKEIEEFLLTFQENDWDSTKVAGHYCLEYLEDQKKNEVAVHLLDGLLKLHPGTTKYLVEKAKHLHGMEKTDEAQKTLRQAYVVAGDERDSVEEKAKEILGDQWNSEGDDSDKPNILDLGKCMFVDPSEDDTSTISAALEDLGVEEVLPFKDSEDAWTWMQANEAPDLIILEWQIPKVSGPFMVQRIRKKFPSIPIIVVSSVLTSADKPLLSEMGVSATCEKPLDKDKLIRIIINTISQDRVPTELGNLERKIRQHLATKNESEALTLLERYKSDSSVSQNRRAALEAEFAFFKGDFERARNLAALGTRAAEVSVHTLNLLGKILIRLGDFESALRCFEKAQDISPKNVERLCKIAEVSAELGDAETAEDAIDAAKEADAESEEVKEAESKVAVTLGDTEKAKEILNNMESIGNLISYMNNKAVSLARSGQVSEGIELYEKTISSIPEKEVDIKASVKYNLALAKIRHDMQADAEDALESVIEMGKTRVLAKSRSLLERLQKALQSGKKLALQNSSQSQGNPGAAGSEELGSPEQASGEQSREFSENEIVSAEVALHPGDLCCFGLFRDNSPPDPNIVKLVKELPRFKIRKAIQKDESAKSA